jgi:putative membrane protein
MKFMLPITTFAGLLAIVLLVLRQDAAAVLSVVWTVGPGLFLIVLVHIFQLLCAGQAWRLALGRTRSPPLPTMIGVRWIRESINSLLPSVQIGGEMVGMRLVALRGLPAGLALAGIVVDVTVEFVTLIPFAIAGLGGVLLAGHDHASLRPLLIGTFTLIPLAAGFLLVQKHGAFDRVERALNWLSEQLPIPETARITGLHDGIHLLYRDRRAIGAAAAWHLMSWFGGVAEVWLILHLVGVPVSVGNALFLESLTQVMRSAAFAIPGALGVQEGGLLLLGSVIGLTPEVSLGLSLTKRAREFLLGVPGILAWHAIERRFPAAAAPAGELPS